MSLHIVMFLSPEEVIIYVDDHYPMSFNYILVRLDSKKITFWYESPEECIQHRNEVYPSYYNGINGYQAITYIDEIIDFLTTHNYLPFE